MIYFLNLLSVAGFGNSIIYYNHILLLLLFFSFSFLSADHELVHGRSRELLDRMSRIDSWHRQISTGRHFQNGHHNTAQIQHCSISMSWIDSRHQKISTYRHFQNGHHNIAKIQHWSISKVTFNLVFNHVVSGRFGRLHNR